MNRELLKGSTAMLVLGMLRGRELYGYELIRALEARSGGVFRFQEGTLYPVLHQLEQEGSVTATWAMAEGRKRKYYRITDQGEACLRDHEAEWKAFSQGVSRVLEGGLTPA